MARRSVPSAQPTYLPHPQHGRKTRTIQDESGFSAFLRNEIFAPEKRSGNINVLTAVTMFVGGIIAFRTWGELMVPA